MIEAILQWFGAGVTVGIIALVIFYAITATLNIINQVTK